MKKIILLAFVLTELFCVQWFMKNNPVILNSSNIERSLLEPGYGKVIKFFTPWCSYCRKLKPIVEKEKERFNSIDKQIRFYDFNCADEQYICDYFRVESYPHMIFFDDQGKAVGDIAGFYPPPTLISLIRDYAEMSTKNTKVKNLLKAETTDQKQTKLQDRIVQNKEINKAKVEQEIVKKQENLEVKEKVLNKDVKEEMKAERSEDKDLEYFHEIVKTILICVLIGVIGFTYLRELLKIEEIEKAKVRNEKIVFDDDIQSQNVRVIRGTSQ